MFKNLFHIASLVFVSLLFGCVTEGDVFEERFVENSKVAESSAIVSFLNEKYIAQSNEAINCFSLKFPIKLSYSTDQLITIINKEGLEQAIKSQSSNFHINGLIFPITAITQGQETFIETVSDFNILLSTCNITNLNTTLLKNINNCIEFQYPVVLFDNSNSEVTITDKLDFIKFIELQGPNYIASFKFPFTLNEGIVINNYLDIYQVTNNCPINNCQIPFVSVTNDNKSGIYKFVAPNFFGDFTYTWSIDNEVIENGVFEGNNNESFSYDFPEDGTYNVCMFAETLECPNGLMYCQDVIVNTIGCGLNICYNYEIEADGSYRFVASGHSGKGAAKYNWLIDGGSTLTEVSGDNNEFLLFNFPENGTYSVCITFETFNCGDEYCETIIVNNK